MHYVLLFVLFHKEDIEHLEPDNISKTSQSLKIFYVSKNNFYLLLADQAVVDGLVGAVAVEPDGNVPLEGELLHQHRLLQGPHQCCLHRHVQVGVRNLDRERC